MSRRARFPLRRVVYGLKNFDLVLVLKDFTQKPVQVSAINVEHLENLKTWLDNCNIKFYEGQANLNWTSIMKHINGMGLEEFYEDGGWKNVLSMEDSEDEGEDPDELESDFEPSGSSEEEEESSEDEYEDEVDSEDESSGEESLDSDESEGQDWEDMEREAKREDRAKGRFEEDEGKPKGKRGKRSGDYSASGSDSEDYKKPAKKHKSSGGSSSKHGGSSSKKYR